MTSQTNRTAQERAYNILKRDGALTTVEIMHKVNDTTVDYKGRIGKARQTFTIHQMSQILRSSPFFVKAGEEAMRGRSEVMNLSRGTQRNPSPLYGRGTRIVYVYDVGDIEAIVKKKMGIKNLIIKVKYWPAFAKEEWVRQGGVIA